jgi:DNA-binding transcriptional MerR regulator
MVEHAKGMTMRFLTSGEVCEAVGIPAPTLEKWVREGALTPAIESTGRGVNRRFTVAQTFAVMVARHLRHERKHDLRAAGGALNALLAYSDEALEREFDAGRTHLMTCNGNIMPRLVSIAHREENKKLEADFAAAGIRCELDWIDLEKPYRRLKKWLQSRERKVKVRA